MGIGHRLDSILGVFSSLHDSGILRSLPMGKSCDTDLPNTSSNRAPSQPCLGPGEEEAETIRSTGGMKTTVSSPISKMWDSYSSHREWGQGES